MREYQDALITSVFGYDDGNECWDKTKHAMTITTWDGKDRALISTDNIHKMYKEICLFGPLAGVYGREVQQILMQNEAPDKISMEDFAYSVQMGRAAIKLGVLRSFYQTHYAADNHSERDRQSQGTRRTRSPRWHDVRDVRETRVRDVREGR